MINNLSVEFPKEKNLCGGFANEKKKTPRLLRRLQPKTTVAETRGDELRPGWFTHEIMELFVWLQ
jgi:hypothetical protein